MQRVTLLCVLTLASLTGCHGTVASPPRPATAPASDPAVVGLALEATCTEGQGCDGNPCTVDKCVNGVCVTGKDAGKPGCCLQDGDCVDSNSCTVDFCDVGMQLCQNLPTGNDECCDTWEDCDDGNCETADYCTPADVCSHTVFPGFCDANIDCDDGKACTIDTCDKTSGCGKCASEQGTVVGCCDADWQCDDSNPCTFDFCEMWNHQCYHDAIYSCCVDAKDAPAACDDKNACTVDFCLNTACRHALVFPGCCQSYKDCGEFGTPGPGFCLPASNGPSICADPDLGKKPCVLGVTSCDDKDPCTADACVKAACTHTPVPDCCQTVADCDDGKPCTDDYCVQAECLHADAADWGVDPPCCAPASAASDCAYLGGPCATGVCDVGKGGSPFFCKVQVGVGCE